MRAIKYTNRFKRDYKREKSGQLGKKLDAVLMEAVNMLAADIRFVPNAFVVQQWRGTMSCVTTQWKRG
jgi:mRNA-degrading endonuclease YafQ of YafQ-DinJ toxin-antitoxin module